MQKFFVARQVLEAHQEVSITEDQYQRVQHAFERLHELVLLEERFDAIAGGFLDFEKAMLAGMLDFTYAGFKGGLHQMSVRRQLNRLLMNALSAARGYIDHLPQTCGAVFGKADARTESCLKSLSASYDSMLGYRMFEALRNHSQHCGFPIHSISYAHQGEGEAPYSRSRLSLSPIADTSELAQNEKFKRSILAEMKQLGSRVDLKPFLREYMRGIARAHYQFRGYATEVSDAYRNAASELTRLFATEAGSSDLLALHATSSKDGWIVGSVPLATGMDEYYKYLSENNGNFDQSSDFYIASAGRDA
tara:strand:+ start:82 stop:999 length:918 start_codon:yes stop_codon:yes gene_type:complete